MRKTFLKLGREQTSFTDKLFSSKEIMIQNYMLMIQICVSVQSGFFTLDHVHDSFHNDVKFFIKNVTNVALRR